MRLLPCCAPLLAAAALTGCADQMLSNDRAVSSIAGQLGVQPADVTVVSRTNDGPTNTVFLVEARGQGRFVCTINGGNVLTFGMTNGAACHRPGAT